MLHPSCGYCNRRKGLLTRDEYLQVINDDAARRRLQRAIAVHVTPDSVPRTRREAEELRQERQARRLAGRRQPADPGCPICRGSGEWRDRRNRPQPCKCTVAGARTLGSRHMKSIRIALTALLLAAACLIPGAPAHATNGGCSSSLGARICLDLSSNSVTIWSGPSTVYAQEYLSIPQTDPSMWPVAQWQSSPAPCYIFYFYGIQMSGFPVNTPAGGFQQVAVLPNPGMSSHGWYTWPVTQTMANLVNWFVNSGAGYECVIQP